MLLDKNLSRSSFEKAFAKKNCDNCNFREKISEKQEGSVV